MRFLISDSPQKGFLRVGFPYEMTLGMRRLTNAPLQVFHPTESDIKILCRHETSTFIRQLSIADDDLGSMSLIGGEVGQIGGGKKIPADFVWPSGIAGDSTGNIFISDEGNHTITHISPEGDLISRWGKVGNEQHEINRPAGIFLDSHDNVFLTDALNYSVKVFSKNGEFIKSWGVKGETSGKFNLPWGICLDQNDDVFVTDWGNHRVQKFSSDGEFLMEFGSFGNMPGQFNYPSGVCVDRDGDIYVSDWGNHRIQLFDRKGRFVEEFRGDATLSKQARDYMMSNLVALRIRDETPIEPQKRLRWPTSSTMGPDGRLYICDYGSHRIQVYKKEIISLGENEIGDSLRAPSLYTQF